MEARVYSSTVEESAIIERVARIVSSVRTAKPDYTRLAEELEGAIPFDVFGVVLLRHDRQAVRVTVCEREKDGWRASYHQHPLEGSKFQRMLLEPPEDGLLVTDYPTGLDGLPASSGDALSRHHQLCSTLIAPLIVEDHALGTLELGSSTIGTYTAHNLQRLVKAVIHVLAAAIESAQVGGRAELQGRQHEALRAVSSSLTSKMELSAILDQVVSSIARALTVSAAIFLFDRRDQHLSLQAQCGLDETILRKMLDSGLMDNPTSIVGRTLQLCQPHVSQDITVDEHFPGSETAFSILGMRSVSCYPLVTGPTIYGVLLLCSPEPGGYTPLKTEILALFVDQATIAIHNGLLIESAHQRSHFQQAIEHLDAACRQETVQEQGDENTLSQELVLLKQIREATTNTFGISFASLMRFISDHLLTRGERDLQAVLTTYHNGFGIDGTPPARANLAGASHHPDPTVAENKDPFEATLALLAQTAEEALERAGMLGELSRLLAQLQQSTNWVRDAWFVVDPNGICFYMNGAAELLCDLHMQRHNSPIYSSLLLGHAQARDTAISITSIFEKLYPRIHNLDEVQSYLQDFTQGCMYRQELRCRIALETADSTSVQAQQSYTPLPANAHATDYHYQFIRYPLYNRQGQLEANALQVRDVTQQALNEHNVSTLLSSVSHDLRTPLTTIKAAVTSLLQEDIAWSEQDRHAMLEDIDSETDHLTVLVHSLIELSRIEMGALSLAREWCDVVEVWYGAWHKLERLAAGRTVHLQAQARLPLIYGDHALLERVFYNLIENALRRSPGNTSITVFIDSIDKEAQLRVRIIDQGKMIPDNVREKLFVSFQNLRTYGNGLGLAICKGIIHAHQGHIWAELSPDNSAEGACFVFTLPTYKYTIEERTKENAHTLSGEVSPVDPVMGGQVR